MDYEINYDTQVLIPIDSNSSKIIEEGNEFMVNSSSFSIMEHSCEYFGSSYEGRKEGTKNILGITHKAPIIVEESRKIIFFPTSSPENPDCMWINLEKVNNYYKLGNKNTAIQFKDGYVVEIKVSYGSLTNQILRATRLKYMLEERTEKKVI